MLGWVLVLESSFSSRITLGFLIIQGGVCGKVLSCILFSGILILVGSTSSEGQKALLIFLFFQNVACISG